MRNVYKSCPKMISLEKLKIFTPLQKKLRMWEICANKLFPQALKNCPKFNKLPNLVTLRVAWSSVIQPKGRNVEKIFLQKIEFDVSWFFLLLLLDLDCAIRRSHLSGPLLRKISIRHWRGIWSWKGSRSRFYGERKNWAVFVLWKNLRLSLLVCH